MATLFCMFWSTFSQLAGPPWTGLSSLLNVRHEAFVGFQGTPRADREPYHNLIGTCHFKCHLTLLVCVAAKNSWYLISNNFIFLTFIEVWTQWLPSKVNVMPFGNRASLTLHVTHCVSYLAECQKNEILCIYIIFAKRIIKVNQNNVFLINCCFGSFTCSDCPQDRITTVSYNSQ